MHKIHPQTASAIAIGIPVKSSQNIFAMRLIAPPPYVTSLPNGKNASPANLKHCKPIGIPMIIMHQPIPAIIHERPAAKPPNINHKIFPSMLMFLFSPLVFLFFDLVLFESFSHYMNCTHTIRIVRAPCRLFSHYTNCSRVSLLDYSGLPRRIHTIKQHHNLCHDHHRKSHREIILLCLVMKQVHRNYTTNRATSK